MPDYLLVDGPLAGQFLSCSDAPETGELLAVEVTDVGEPDASFHGYVVEVAAQWRRPGRLRHADREDVA